RSAGFVYTRRNSRNGSWSWPAFPPRPSENQPAASGSCVSSTNWGSKKFIRTRSATALERIPVIAPAATRCLVLLSPLSPPHRRQQGSRLYGPGVSDNGAGVTAMLAIAAALQDVAISHALPLLFVGNVGEEGEGDLRGMRHIFSSPRWKNAIQASLILDGAGTDTVVTEALGSRRFEVIVRGPAVHSCSDFR